MENKKISYEDATKVMQGPVKTCIEELEKVLSCIYNLKLYDAFFESDNIIEETLKERLKGFSRFESETRKCINSGYGAFHNFCEFEYRNFTEWMEWEKIEDPRQYIGRTSSFYIGSFHKEYLDDLGAALELEYNTNITATADGVVYGNDITEDQAELNYIVSGELERDIKEHFRNDLMVASYITDFKKDQKENFKAFLEDEIENCLYWLVEAENKEKEEKELFCINTAALIFA